MRILFTTANAIDFIGADTLSYFDLEVARHADCKFAGPGYPLYKEGEHVNDTVKRIYGDESPDWVYGVSTRKKQEYRTAGRIIDLHREVTEKINRINRACYDHMFFYYRYCLYSSEDKGFSDWKLYKPDYFWEQVICNKTWLPWSYESSVYYPTNEDPLYDVTLLGDVGLPVYPLRMILFRDLPKLCEENEWKLLLRNRIPGRFTLDGRTLRRKSVILSDPKLRSKYFVGPDYAEVLRRSRVFIFGSSIMGYTVKKWFECMGSGTCVLADEPLMAEEIGLIDGYNYIRIDAETWQDKLRWVLENESERQKIARRGYELMSARHTHEIRAKEMLKILEGYNVP